MTYDVLHHTCIIRCRRSNLRCRRLARIQMAGTFGMEMSFGPAFLLGDCVADTPDSLSTASPAIVPETFSLFLLSGLSLPALSSSASGPVAAVLVRPRPRPPPAPLFLLLSLSLSSSDSSSSADVAAAAPARPRPRPPSLTVAAAAMLQPTSAAAAMLPLPPPVVVVTGPGPRGSEETTRST